MSWCFHTFAPGQDPSDSIDILGELGFEGTDLILQGDLSPLAGDEKEYLS